MAEVSKLDVSVEYILTCEDIGELVEISREGGAIAEAMWKSNKFRGTPKYYKAAKASLWSEWRAGHQLKYVEREQGARTDLTLSDSRTKLGFRNTINGYGLKHDTAYRWIAMSFAPRASVETYVERREAKNLPLKRSEVLKIGKAHKPLEAPQVSDRYRIIHADLLEAEIEDESIDCIITDPP